MFKDGLLIELDQDGRPILDLWWTGDTPHPQDASHPWQEPSIAQNLLGQQFLKQTSALESRPELRGRGYY